ncbi:hypothetical protein SteCoe_27584 [Stentor coeruleus]|uniref:Uncharacterized protein n=1 Tax=Stentor coeruleus TaxID=5963 RepID=A0A1R2BA99_9CILI|nr:hypothetical protein SteCoe_27584 [Stentor coeruleus]
MESSQNNLIESDNLNNYIIQENSKDNYLWKITCTEEQYPEINLDELKKLNSTFSLEFFALGRGQTSNLENLVKEYTKIIKKDICNIDLDDFLNKAKEIFNYFHSENMSIQLEKTRDILTSVKSSYKFNNIYRRPIISDLHLEREESIFLTKMFETKNFTTENFMKEFTSAFKNFIKVYNPIIEKTIEKDYVERIMQGFSYEFSKLLAEARNRLNTLLGDVILNFKPMKLRIMIYQLTDNENMQKMTQWEIIYEEFIHREPAYIKQVIKFSSNSVIVCVSFPIKNMIQLIRIFNFESKAISNMLPDCNTVIADGSTEDCLVFMQNTIKHAFIGRFYDDRIHINNEFPVYSENIKEIKVVCYLKSKNEFFIINQNGELSIYSVDPKKTKTSTNQVPISTQFKHISLTNCERFIVLLSYSEAYVFTSDLKLIYMDHSTPFYASIRGSFFEMINLNSSMNINIKKVPLDSENFVHNPNMNNVTTIMTINANIRNTLKLTSDLITGMLEDEHFGP